MVQVVENRSQVRGRVVGIAPHPTLGGYVTIDLALSHVEAVPGYANMFGDQVGSVVRVNVPTDEVLSNALAGGDVISARIRRAGPQAVFAEAGTVAKTSGG
jgi:hypothetical protein